MLNVRLSSDRKLRHTHIYSYERLRVKTTELTANTLKNLNTAK